MFKEKHLLLDILRVLYKLTPMGNLLSSYCHFFATQNIGGAKELVVLL
jgi:hypothetical protein